MSDIGSKLNNARIHTELGIHELGLLTSVLPVQPLKDVEQLIFIQGLR